MEEAATVDMLEYHIDSGKAFKDTHGEFNYKLCFSDGLIKPSRNSNGELIEPEVRTQNDVDKSKKTRVIG